MKMSREACVFALLLIARLDGGLGSVKEGSRETEKVFRYDAREGSRNSRLRAVKFGDQAGAAVLSRDHVVPVSATEVQLVEKESPGDAKDKALRDVEKTGRKLKDLHSDAKDDAVRDVEKTGQKLKDFKRSGHVEEFRFGFVAIWDIFLHGLRFKPSFMRISAGIFFFGTLWLWFYFKYCLRLDRNERQKDNEHLEELRNADPSIGDVVYVFDHPNGPQAEADKETYMDPRPLAADLFNGHPEEFPRMKELMDRLDEAPEQFEEPADSTRNVQAAACSCNSDCVLEVAKDIKDMAAQMAGVQQKVTLWDVKVALLQDASDVLGGMGFNLAAFTSIDKDEIYLCCSIQDSEVVEDFLENNDARLQILPNVVKGLKIRYPANIDQEKAYLYDPPYLRYDPKGMVGRLKDAMVIEQRDPRLLYQHNHPGGEFAGAKDRVRMIARRLTSLLDSDDAVNQGIMKAWFVMHNKPSTDHLSENWASFSFLTDLTFIQPIATIYEYFGSRIAFMFAWNGLYCRALLGLAPIAILVGGSTALCLRLNIYLDVVAANPMGLGFSLVLMVWCRMTSNMWIQNQRYHIEDWDILEQAGVKRPNYRGEMRPSEVDLNKMEKYYPPEYAAMWRFFSTIVTLAFCCLVAVAAYFWDHVFDGKVSLTGAILLAIEIKVFELVYHHVAVHLTECENHKFNTGHYNYFVWKKVMFYAVNSYYPFVYIAVVQGAYQQRCDGDCIIILRQMLLLTMSVLVAWRVVELAIASLVVEFKVWLEAWQIKRSGLFEPGKEPKISFEERQAKSGPYRSNEQAETMLQLVLPLGYLLLFGCTTPIVAVLCLLLFMVNLRATGTLLLCSSQRPFPSRGKGIGAWQEILALMQRVAMFANGFFLVEYGAIFQGTPVFTKCSFLLIFVVFIRFLWQIVDYFVPQESKEVKLLVRRRKHVVDKISKVSHKKFSRDAFSPRRMQNSESPLASARLAPPAAAPSEPRVVDFSIASPDRLAELETLMNQAAAKQEFLKAEKYKNEIADIKDLKGINKTREPPLETTAEDAAGTMAAPTAMVEEKAFVLTEDFEDIALFPGAEAGTEIGALCPGGVRRAMAAP